jgi:hypothetical protein
VDVQIVPHQHDQRDFRIAHVEQILDPVRLIHARALLGDVRKPHAAQGLEADEDGRRAIPLIFVIQASWLTGLCRERL